MSEFDFKLFSASFDKQFGKDALIDLNKQPRKGEPGTFIPTPSETINRVLGIGGLPVGKIVEVFGDESSGKSTFALECVKSAQQTFPKLPVAYIDAEQSVNIEYAQAIGIDTNPKRFLFVQENETEKALDMAHSFAKAGVSLVVVDSVPALISAKELEEQETTEGKMGGNSKALSSHLRYMLGTCPKSNTVALYINQVRTNIGVMFGNPETTPGGKAMKFYASVRLRTSIKEQLKDKNGEAVGVRVKVRNIKNKVGPPYRFGEYNLVFGQGIDAIGDLIDVCSEVGILAKSGAFYTVGDKKIQGREAMKQYVAENPDYRKVLTDTLWSVS